MTAWFRTHRVPALIALVLVPIICGTIFLSGSAPRDWSLHWKQPRSVVAAASNESYAVAPSAAGWDVLWLTPTDTLMLSRFDHQWRRVTPDAALSTSAQTPSLAVTGNRALAVWRQDTSNSSDLRGALAVGRSVPRRLMLASGTWPLEHPYAFAAGKELDAVFSWQRPGPFDVYLVRVRANGAAVGPRRLTHTPNYAFLPQAAGTAGRVQLIYMAECCGGGIFRLMHAVYSPSGRLLASPQVVDSHITTQSSPNSAGTPPSWGLSILAASGRVWAAWSGDPGLSVASWHDNGTVATSARVAIPQIPSDAVALVSARGHTSLIWQQPYDLGTFLASVRLSSTGRPLDLANPDRVAYESASDTLPQALAVGGVPAVAWIASPGQSSSSRIEISTFTPKAQGPPSFWAQLGLGLSNPLGNLAIVLVGALGLGLVGAVANFLLVFAMVVLYFIVARLVRVATVKWYVYWALVTVLLYALFVGPLSHVGVIIGISRLPPGLGLVAIAGTGLFTILLLWTVLRRLDDVFRAGLLAFAAIYFIAFLTAVTTVQSTVAKI